MVKFQAYCLISASHKRQVLRPQTVHEVSLGRIAGWNAPAAATRPHKAYAIRFEAKYRMQSHP